LTGGDYGHQKREGETVFCDWWQQGTVKESLMSRTKKKRKAVKLWRDFKEGCRNFK